MMIGKRGRERRRRRYFLTLHIASNSLNNIFRTDLGMKTKNTRLSRQFSNDDLSRKLGFFLLCQ